MNKELSLIQSPSKENGREAIVHARYYQNNQYGDGLGTASPQDDSTLQTTQQIIDHASIRAIERAKHNLLNGTTSESSTHSANQIHQQYSNHSGKERKHNPTPGSITKGQQSALDRMCSERNISLQQIANERYSQPISQLSSKQANDLMQTIRNIPRV